MQRGCYDVLGKATYLQFFSFFVHRIQHSPTTLSKKQQMIRVIYDLELILHICLDFFSVFFF